MVRLGGWRGGPLTLPREVVVGESSEAVSRMDEDLRGWAERHMAPAALRAWLARSHRRLLLDVLAPCAEFLW
jgi:hypothetical protein